MNGRSVKQWVVALLTQIPLVAIACGAIQPLQPTLTPDSGQTAVAYYFNPPDTSGGTSTVVHETSNATGRPTRADRVMRGWIPFPVETHTAGTATSWQIALGTMGVTLNQSGVLASSWTANFVGPDEAPDQVAMGADGSIAYASTAGVDTVAPDGTARSYKILPPDNCPSPVRLSLPPSTGITLPGAGWVDVRAVLFAPDGHVIVGAPGCDGPVIVDITAGRRSTVGSGCGRIEGMAFGLDGNLYAVCLESGSPGDASNGYPYAFVVVNYSTLTPIRSAPTGYYATGGTVFSMAVTNAAVYAYVTVQRTPGPPESHHLYELAFGGKVVQELTVTTTGYKVHGVGNGTLLFYPGTTGSDGNLVTSWKPASGPMAQTALTAPLSPTGSYLSAVFIG